MAANNRKLTPRPRSYEDGKDLGMIFVANSISEESKQNSSEQAKEVGM